MTELLTAAQMRAIEEAAIASGQVTGLELMERAGRGVVEAIFEEWPDLQAAPHRAVVLCGPGNNGGDGFVVARLLREWGWEVEVFLYGDPERLPPDARANYERWCGMGEVVAMDAAAQDKFRGFGDGDRPDLWVDAIFGSGLSRAVAAEVGETFHSVGVGFCEHIYELPGKVVAIDVPSGLDSDAGVERFVDAGSGFSDVFSGQGAPEWKIVPRSPYNCLRCDLTVTFHAARTGHFLDDAAKYCGRLVVKDIGLGRPRHITSATVLIKPADREDPVIWSLGKPNRTKSTAHKYSHGHALILSGPPGHTGAARLAARGALRIGAGLVTIGAAPPAIPEHAAQLTAIMLRELPDGQALTEALGDARITALCLGPGLGLDQNAAGLLTVALGVNPAPGLTRGPSHPADSGIGGGPGSSPGRGPAQRATVLDADALTLLARDPTLFGALHPNCILTPHAGEFARLFPDIAERLAAPAATGPAWSKLDATRDAARRAGCVVLFKGPDTVIADPSGRAAINSAHYDRAAPWLATAGSGDVLAGFITGLLARGFAPFDAACTAAWLHVECALHFGPGLIAEDLPEELPKVFRALGL